MKAFLKQLVLGVLLEVKEIFKSACDPKIYTFDKEDFIHLSSIIISLFLFLLFLGILFVGSIGIVYLNVQTYTTCASLLQDPPDKYHVSRTVSERCGDSLLVIKYNRYDEKIEEIKKPLIDPNANDKHAGISMHESYSRDFFSPSINSMPMVVTNSDDTLIEFSVTFRDLNGDTINLK